MEKIDTLEKLRKKDINAEDTAKDVIKNPGLLPKILDGISSENPRIRFKSAKILRVVSEKIPRCCTPRWIFLQISLVARIESLNGLP